MARVAGVLALLVGSAVAFTPSPRFPTLRRQRGASARVAMGMERTFIMVGLFSYVSVSSAADSGPSNVRGGCRVHEPDARCSTEAIALCGVDSLGSFRMSPRLQL